MNPTISVIVPVYNVEKYLYKCIDSIINQTYKHLEIILIDDESPDNCGVICDEYAEKDKRIKVIHQKNKGVSAARNTGLEIATGDFIGFVDSDDWILEKMYETLITQAILNQSDLTSCVVKKSSMTNEKRLEKQKPIILEKKELFYNYQNFGFYVMRSLYSKEILKDLKFDENIPFVEDIFFGIDLIDRVEKSVFIEYPFYIYNDDNEMSLTRVKYNKNIFMTIDANVYIKKKVTKIFPNDIELQTIFRERIIGNCLFHLQNLYLKENSHLDKDGLMKIKIKKIYNDNFGLYKNPSVFQKLIRLLNVSLLKYFYRTYFVLSKMRS